MTNRLSSFPSSTSSSFSSASYSSEEDALEGALSNASGLVFDCDGTLIDTMPIYYKSWSRACEELGLEFPIEQFYAFAGAPVADIFDTLIQDQKSKGNVDTKLTPQYCESVKRRHHKDIEHEGAIPGPIDVVVSIVKRFHGKMPMAVASSGWRDHVISNLERVGILHLFDAVVTADEEVVKCGKPAPDIFLVAAERINVCPTKCVGFEDADFGMEALKRAGYWYASDVRLFHMYPRNVEKRMLTGQRQQVEGNKVENECKDSLI